MTTERGMLEYAAKACGLSIIGFANDNLAIRSDGCVSGYVWNPITNSADCAAMCAELNINTFFYELPPKVECYVEDVCNEQIIRCIKDYTPQKKLKEWMYAATMVAAKIGGME